MTKAVCVCVCACVWRMCACVCVCVCACMCMCVCSEAQPSGSLWPSWTVARQASPPAGPSRRASWSGKTTSSSGATAQSKDRTCFSYVSCTGRQMSFH